jgi:hypothetical protein
LAKSAESLENKGVEFAECKRVRKSLEVREIDEAEGEMELKGFENEFDAVGALGRGDRSTKAMAP